jgi:glycosyltransferase involved in cell wall biosynthesis
MKRVLYIHHTFRDQSYNSLLYEFAKRVNNKKKYEIFACCLRGDGPYEKKLDDIGVQVRNFRMNNLLKFWVVFKIVQYIKDNRINIVNTASFPSDVYGRIAAKLAGVPIILSTLHRLDGHKHERIYRLFFWLDTLTMLFTTKIIAVSKIARDYLIQWHNVNPTKIVTLYNGIDTNKYKADMNGSCLLNEFNLHKNYPTVGVIGRLDKMKGIDCFLNAVAEIVKKTKEAQFLIVGDGPLKGELKKRAYYLGILERVVFTGFRKDIPDILSIIDILVASTLSEALPTSILEGMSAGKPVVATNVGGVPEVVINGETGILIPSKDSDALAAAILELLESPEKRVMMGKKGRQHVMEHFSIENMVREYERFYDSL